MPTLYCPVVRRAIAERRGSSRHTGGARAFAAGGGFGGDATIAMVRAPHHAPAAREAGGVPAVRRGRGTGEAEMNRRLLLAVLFLSLCVLFPGIVAAACRYEWDCSQGYPCRQVPICDSPLDVPASTAPGISPIPPPSIRPVPTPTVPPVGTQSCQPTYLCDSIGRCAWRTVCQ